MINIRAIVRSEALQRVPKGYRLLNDDERVFEGDLHYIYDEYWLEDKGKAKTWQRLSSEPFFREKADGSAIQWNLGRTAREFHCAIRKNNSKHTWRRLAFWIALQLERFQAWKFRRFINE